MKHLIKRFDFTEDNRERVTLGTNVRLNPDEHRLQLKADATGAYPTTANLFAKTWTTNPKTAKRWVGFMVDLKNFKNELGVFVTDVRYRLGNGVSDMYWNGSAWAVAGAGNWSTEAEVAANIASFPVATQTLQVILNLSTSDFQYSPLVYSVRVLYQSDVEELEDYIWRSLVPDMRAKLRVIGEHAVKTAAPTSSLDLDTFRIETPYEIVGMDSVYDLTADPSKLSNLLSSYDVGTKVITLSASVPAAHDVLVRFVYQPIIAVTTSQDYIEIERVPHIVLDDIKQARTYQHSGEDYVLDKVSGEGVKVTVTMGDLDVSGIFVTDKAKDHARLSDAIKRYFADNRLLRSVGQDELFTMYLVDEYDAELVATQNDLQSGRFRCRICKALFYDGDGVNIVGVLNFRPTFVRTVS